MAYKLSDAQKEQVVRHFLGSDKAKRVRMLGGALDVLHGRKKADAKLYAACELIADVAANRHQKKLQ